MSHWPDFAVSRSSGVTAESADESHIEVEQQDVQQGVYMSMSSRSSPPITTRDHCTTPCGSRTPPPRTSPRGSVERALADAAATGPRPPPAPPAPGIAPAGTASDDTLWGDPGAATDDRAYQSNRFDDQFQPGFKPWEKRKEAWKGRIWCASR